MAVVITMVITLADCERCYGLRVGGGEGGARRISRTYVETYGCESFDDVRTVDDMIAWCEAKQLGDTVAADVTPGCRPGEALGGCELFWTCE